MREGEEWKNFALISRSSVNKKEKNITHAKRFTKIYTSSSAYARSLGE